MSPSTGRWIAIAALIGLVGVCAWSLLSRQAPEADVPDRVYAVAFAGAPLQLVMLTGQGLERGGSPDSYQLENDPELAPSKRAGWTEMTVQEFGKRTVWSDDGNWLIFQNGDNVEIWGTEADPERTAVLEGAGRDLKIMLLSLDGSTLITDQADPNQGRQVWLLDQGKAELLSRLPGEGTLLALNPYGNLAAVTTDQQIELIDVADGTSWRSIPVPGNSPADVIAFSPDGELVAATAGAQPRPEVWVWKVSDGSLFNTLKLFNDPITTLAFSSNSAQLAAGGGSENTGTATDAKVRVWHLRGDRGKTLDRGVLPEQTVVAPIARLVFHPSGRILMALTNDRKMNIWLDPAP